MLRNVLVVGLVRNCGHSVAVEVAAISTALRFVQHLSWLIVESDSSDNTLDVLQGLQARTQNFRFLSLGALGQHLPQRTARLAQCRNRYLLELRQNPLYAEIDHVVVADLDGVNRDLTETAIRSCWTRVDWDVCTANQRDAYYDIWALRHPLWSPNDCWRHYADLIARGLKPEYAHLVAVSSRMIAIAEDTDWIEVDSAFGGLAIYRRAILQDFTYSGLDASGGEICDHPTLHQQIRAAGGRIFINPRLINGGLNEHTAPYKGLLDAMRA
jgi:hypothetical protein